MLNPYGEPRDGRTRASSCVLGAGPVVMTVSPEAGSCLQEGIPSSNGAVTCHADGLVYECRDGSWRVDSRSHCDPSGPLRSGAGLVLPGDLFRPSTAR